MLSGVKFIPRDQIDKVKAESSDDSSKETPRSGKRKHKRKSKKSSSRYDSSGEDDLEIIPTKSKKKKKWYSSDEGCSSSTGSESDGGSDSGGKRHRKKKRVKKGSKKDRAHKSKSRRNNKSSDDSSSSDSGKEQKEKSTDKGSRSVDDHNTVRKEMGLEWMLRPKNSAEKNPTLISDQPEEGQEEEVKKENPRELNPYFKNNGMGYPEEEEDATKVGGGKILSASIVGDGGASWRLKALKRAQEQAAREGRDLQEVVGDRWGSLGQLTVSVASRSAAPSRSHLHAIRNRQRGQNEEQQTNGDDQRRKVTGKNFGHERQEGVSQRHPEMKVPKVHGSLSWGKKKGQPMSSGDASVISSAMSSINKFANDGNFMREALSRKTNDGDDGSVVAPYDKAEPKSVPSEPRRSTDAAAAVNQGLSANQLAAKAMQLRLKGKHEEAEILLKEVETMRAEKAAGDSSNRQQNEGNTRRYAVHDSSIRKQKQADDADMNLARTIMQNSKFSISGQADDEYDFEDGPKRKSKKKVGNDHKSSQKANYPTRIMTQQERCQFCFENPSRPRHLVVAIANFTYLSLPHWQSVVPGHCCILTLQHESATRGVDDNVWDEIRNFKKCLFMMFAKQNKDVVFLETVMGLAKQRRHCMVECIPLPKDIAGDAPLYFKKAIDEAEDEWSQHNSKKLIDTSESGKGVGKGLRSSIPKDFPYFHVEFGPSKGFVHVIDNEEEFKSNFGVNVIRGLLELPEEDMYGRRKRDSLETQTRAVASFTKDWAPFDWTKQLDS